MTNVCGRKATTQSHFTVWAAQDRLEWAVKGQVGIISCCFVRFLVSATQLFFTILFMFTSLFCGACLQQYQAYSEESEQLLWWGSIFLHIHQPYALLEASSSVPPHQGLQLNLGEWCCWVCGSIPGQTVFISVWKEHMLLSSSVTTSSVICVS